ncbi:C6 transcription factor [Histoplasma capsulatum var. duboisii H88]|uniref:C6 transcription factor n=1 Tax=Ajellomyces capsulatus (strain H88) TaxID=544711 RepID=F0URE4_AJEC8|nr:C6 transcription factor [Histoplasma capsulatum var. duboisii H88]QSS50490.1 C6 transcription factor [Histoplasma capsulatum var. duboisii H88]
MVSIEAVEPQRQNKRKAAAAGIQTTSRPIKRRASKACCCCRARKVRCDVVENGSPCTNCRLDEVKCVVTESKRRKKSRTEGSASKPSQVQSANTPDDSAFAFNTNNDDHIKAPIPDPLAPLSPNQLSVDFDHDHHVPHLLYQTQGSRVKHEHRQRRMSSISARPVAHSLRNMTSAVQQLLDVDFGGPISPKISQQAKGWLPNFIRPLPAKFQSDDIAYLEAKGALTIPSQGLRNELMKSYLQFVHPYMPFLELDEFLRTIARNDGSLRMSLLLFQASMFAGTAFISMKHLIEAGYESRKEARKAFFQRARLLYDFDYEVDRISLVQSLLLMTHWYEMPDDQKDTWHWMGVSLSLGHTIGLHRDPSTSCMDSRRQKLWKRVWWSTYTRDRLIALGMRRPTRIKDEDCNVPMLTLDDFDIQPLSAEALQIVGDCELVHNIDQQRQLASMFVEKSKLCLCISHVLRAQYSILGHKFGGTTETTMMLVPKKATSETCEVRKCDQELEAWLADLPEAAQYRRPSSPSFANGEEVLHIHRALLRMIYLTTSSALHRPQVLPPTPFPTVETGLQDLSRSKVRSAAIEITDIAQRLHTMDLTRYLPTTGVTVLLPAVIIHLLDIKSNDLGVRSASLHRFYQCMQILQRLREIYASADFATSFLEAAIRKAGIQVTTQVLQGRQGRPVQPGAIRFSTGHVDTLTPPPDSMTDKIPDFAYPSVTPNVHFAQVEKPDTFYTSTPPQSVGSENGSINNIHPDFFSDEAHVNGAEDSDSNLAEFMNLAHDADINQNDLDALINFDDTGANYYASEDAINGIDLTISSMSNDNSSRFSLDHIDWMQDFPENNNNHNMGTDNNNNMQMDSHHGQNPLDSDDKAGEQVDTSDRYSKHAFVANAGAKAASPMSPNGSESFQLRAISMPIGMGFNASI